MTPRSVPMPSIKRKRSKLPGLPPYRARLLVNNLRPPASLHTALSAMTAPRQSFDTLDLSALVLLHMEDRGITRAQAESAVVVWADDDDGLPVVHVHWPEVRA